MAFNIRRFTRVSLSDNTGAQTVVLNPDTTPILVNGPALFTYASADDAIATIAGANYFNPESAIYDLKVGDMIICKGSDANLILEVAAVSLTASPKTISTVSFTPAGLVATANIVDNAVTTAKIANANVTLAKLASGITPSHIIKFSAKVTTVGGAAAEAFAVVGALAATDNAFVQVVDNGTGNVTVLQAVVTNDTLTVTFSGNPGNDAIINYQLVRAAS